MRESGYAGAATEVAAPAISVRVTVYGRWTLLPKP
jgi:hypothetical protein